jgi:polar amino acid transport system substrate-binding protein
MRWRVVGVVALVAGVLASCGLSVPTDPNGTLDRVTGATLRVGVSPNPPWTDVTQGSEPTGTEVVLVREFAATLPAEVSWTVGGEEALITALEHGELDLVIGGLTADTPWEKHVAITKPYAEGTGPDGKRIKLVMAAPPGENAYLLRLEKFLISRSSV